MFNVQEYIESGVLQDYCLGLLSQEEQHLVENNCRKYPVLQDELEACRQAMNQYAGAFSKKPPEHLKSSIWQVLENIGLEERGDLNQLPFLNKYSSSQQWLKIVKPLLPEALDDDMFVKVIRDDEETMQTVIWSRVDYPDEVHDDLQECFMVLEGECECHVGDEIIHVGPGGFFEIPLHVHHDVKILTPYVLAVVQRKKIA
jgi:mannose-6-phosphate isomerase-like protein (cupin superfamily)